MRTVELTMLTAGLPSLLASKGELVGTARCAVRKWRSTMVLVRMLSRHPASIADAAARRLYQKIIKKS